MTATPRCPFVYSRDQLLGLRQHSHAGVQHEIPAVIKRNYRGCRAGKTRRLRRKRFRPAPPSVVTGNVRSLVNKMEEIATLTRTEKVFRECSVMCFTETWLHKNIPDQVVDINGFTCVRADRDPGSSEKKRGGGLALYVNNRWCSPSHVKVYAPISGQDRSFHRTLFFFCCKTPECYTRNESRCMKVFRNQLPRRNEFYPYDPPPEDEPPCDAEEGQSVLPVSGVKLCWVCGCPGNKACSRCHTVTYCGKHHQTLHWKQSHKKECGSQEGSPVTPSPLLFPETELVTEPEEEEEEYDVKEAEGEQEVEDGGGISTQRSVDCPSLAESLAESDLEEMAMHETEDSKVFQRFKKKIAPEPHQVIRYSRGGSPLWVSSQHVPSDEDIPSCTCGAKRTFEFQVMPQLLNNLSVDSTGASIDWGTVAVYTCSASCERSDQYCPEVIWKQDFSSDQHTQTERR